MTFHRRPPGPGGEFDETPGDDEGTPPNEDLSSREETTEASGRSGPDAGMEASPASDPGRMTDDELEAHVLATVERMNALEADLASAVAELDRRRIPDERHVLSTKQWLRKACRMSASRASTVLSMGRSLERMPITARLARSGAITPSGLRMLTSARNDHPHDFTDHEGVLADAATYLGPKDLRRAIRYWRQQIAYPDAVTEAEDKKRRRRLSCSQTWDGMWSVSGTLDPESGHVVATALRARTGSAALDPDDHRTAGQRSADALVDVCRFSLDHDDTIETSGGTKPHITATIDVRTLGSNADANDLEPNGEQTDEHDPVAPDEPPAHRPPLPEVDGEAITPEDARRLACDAGVTRIITDGPSQILDVGRTTRTIPPATRRAVEHRDRGCAWTGCDAHISWCDVHHVLHWAHGGPTDIDNLMLLCRRHHTAVHEGRAPPR